MPKVIRANNEGDILSYGLMSTATMMRQIDDGHRMIQVDTFFKDMDQHYIVNANDEVVKKEA